MSNNLKVYFASVDAILMVDDFEQHLPTPKTNMKPENASEEKEKHQPKPPICWGSECQVLRE